MTITNTKNLLVLSVLVLMFTGGVVFAANVKDSDLKVIKSKVLPAALVKKKMGDLLKSDRHINAAGAHVTKKLGYKALAGNNNYLGLEITLQNVKSKKTLKCEITLLDYGKAGSKDLVLVGQTVITAEEKKEVYPFLVVAPKGDFSSYNESYIDPLRLKVLPTKGIITCLINTISTKYPKVAGALQTCAKGTWTGYFKCLNETLKDDFAKAIVCCSCDCAPICINTCGCCEK